MPFHVIRNDITKVQADAIVNTANPYPRVGRGSDSAIYQAAGWEELLEARKKIGEIARGEAAVTPAFALNARYIIHTVGPVWQGGGSGEEQVLRNCYRNCLRKAREMKCSSIAFPLISAGTYGFPADKGLEIALSEFSSFLMKEDEEEMDILMVVFDRHSAHLSAKLFPDMESYIDDHYAGEKSREEHGNTEGFLRENRRKAAVRKRGRYFERQDAAVRERDRYPERQDAVVREESIRTEQQNVFILRNAADESCAENVEVYDIEDPDAAAVDAEEVQDVNDWGDWDFDDHADKEDGLTYGGQREVAPPPLMQSLPEEKKCSAAKPEKTDADRQAVTGAAIKKRDLRELIYHVSDTFQERLFRLIDERGLTNPQVYKRANLTKKLFSKINSNPDYHPTKATALSLAIALELNLDETTDLLARAGLALSPCSQQDIIVRYFIETGKYDILAIDYALADLGLKTLGNYE